MRRNLDAMPGRKLILMASMMIVLVLCAGTICSAQAVSVGDARASVGTTVTISGAVVTASFGDAFWIESDNRSAGIKVVSNANPGIGKTVEVTGEVVRSGSEISIINPSVTVGVDGTVPPPIAITGRTAGEFDKGGAAAQGLFVKVAGKITTAEKDANNFVTGYYLDDGSGLTGDGTNKGLYVKIDSSLPYPANAFQQDQFITVVGVLTVESVNSNFVPTIRTIGPEKVSSFLAFNDVAWAADTGQPETNITKYSLPGPDGGYLRDYYTGTYVPEKVAIQSSCATTLNSGADFTISTSDAFKYFQVNGQWAVSCKTTWYVSNHENWYSDVTFSGLDPNALYEYVCTVNRGYNSYHTRYTISGVGNSISANYVAGNTINGSSSGTKSTDGTSASFATNNTSAGYVARWYNIKPAADGTFTVRATSADTITRYGHIYGVFRLQKQSEELTQ